MKAPKNTCKNIPKIAKYSYSTQKILNLTELFYSYGVNGVRDKYQVCSIETHANLTWDTRTGFATWTVDTQSDATEETHGKC